MSETAGPRPARWALLAAFAALVAATQVLWLSFAPVTTRAADALGVSEGAIGDLAVVNPVMYVLLAIPAGGAPAGEANATMVPSAAMTGSTTASGISSRTDPTPEARV